MLERAALERCDRCDELLDLIHEYAGGRASICHAQYHSAVVGIGLGSRDHDAAYSHCVLCKVPAECRQRTGPVRHLHMQACRSKNARRDICEFAGIAAGIVSDQYRCAGTRIRPEEGKRHCNAGDRRGIEPLAIACPPATRSEPDDSHKAPRA